MGFLENFYNGKHGHPWERYEKRTPELIEAVKQIEEDEKYILSKLPPEDTERFYEYTKLHGKLAQLGNESLFAYSFSLGLRFGVEAVKEIEALDDEE